MLTKRGKQTGFLMDKNKEEEEEICYSSMSCTIIVRRKTDERGSNNLRQTHLTEKKKTIDTHQSKQRRNREKKTMEFCIKSVDMFRVEVDLIFLFEHLT